MDGIKRKTIQRKAREAESPEPEVREVRILRDAPPVVEEKEVAEIASAAEDRIEQNPFFKKEKHAVRHHQPVHHRRPRHHSRLPSTRLLVGLSATLGLAAVVFFGLSYFSSATINVVPLTESATLGNDLVATKDAKEGTLQFHFMSLRDEKTKEVKATNEEKVQKKASGHVVIYNAYGAAPQRLIKNTRLETPDHKIFRIDDSVVVPGATMDGTRVATPGSVEAVVYADAPGEDYNIGLADFTIPGFKGDPRYTKFTARSKAENPIAGGFSGTIKVPAQEDIAAAQKELKETLKSSAIEKARAQMPGGVTFFPGSMILKFEEVPQDLGAGKAAQVTMRATVSVFFFDTDSLTQKIMETVLPERAKTPFDLINKDDIVFTFADPVENVVLGDLDHIKFHLSGNALFEGRVDAGKLVKNLAGKNKDSFSEVIALEPNIKKATSSMFPLWNQTFPEDTDRITVKTVRE